MSYKNITTSQIAPGKFVTSAQGLAWSNNPKAIAEADDSGDTAPRILCRASGNSAIAAPGGSAGQFLKVTDVNGPDGNPIVRPASALEVTGQQRMYARIERGKVGGTTQGTETTGFLGFSDISFNGLNQCLSHPIELDTIIPKWGYAPGQLPVHFVMIVDDSGRDNTEWWYANFTKVTSDSSYVYFHFQTFSSGYTWTPPASPIAVPKSGVDTLITRMENTPGDPTGTWLELRVDYNAGRPRFKFVSDSDSVNDVSFGAIHFNYVQFSG